MPDSLKIFLEKYHPAGTGESQKVFELMNKHPHSIYVRDVNAGVIADVASFAKGPFILSKDDEGNFYIKGMEIEGDRERHLRIVENGVVELRSPGEHWFKPSMGAIRLYIENEK